MSGDARRNLSCSAFAALAPASPACCARRTVRQIRQACIQLQYEEQYETYYIHFRLKLLQYHIKKHRCIFVLNNTNTICFSYQFLNSSYLMPAHNIFHLFCHICPHGHGIFVSSSLLLTPKYEYFYIFVLQYTIQFNIHATYYPYQSVVLGEGNNFDKIRKIDQIGPNLIWTSTQMSLVSHCHCEKLAMKPLGSVVDIPLM